MLFINNNEIRLLTPLAGLVLKVVASLAGVRMRDLTHSVWPFPVFHTVALLLVPSIAMVKWPLAWPLK